MTLISNWKTEVFQCLIVMLITYHSWKHNSCCDNISEPCSRHGADTVQPQSHCAKKGEKNTTEGLFAHFYQQTASPSPAEAAGSPGCSGSSAAGEDEPPGPTFYQGQTPTPSEIQGRNRLVQTELLEVWKIPSAFDRPLIPAGNKSGQYAIHYNPRRNCVPTSQISTHKAKKKGRN